VVDNPELAALKGMNPNVVTAVSWAVGSSLAGLAAILIAAGQNLDIRVLSLLVVTAYAAAVVGRLQSVPLTYVGAMALGISEALVVGYLPQDNEFVRTLRPSLPFLLLFVMLLVRRDTQLPERVQAVAQGRPPGPATACACAAVGVAAAALAAPHLSPARLVIGSSGLVFALLALSLVLLTGFSGQVSLTQLGFAGLGAVTMGRLAGQVPPLLALAAAGCLAAVVGAVVALPALRLQGIYLALSTLAFALMLDYMVFDSQAVMGPRISLTVPRPSLFGISLAGERAMFVFLAAVCAAASVLVVAIRRGPFGRLLTALRDAPVAVATLGANPVGIKVKVFTLSAFLAGVAGALLGGLQSKVSPIDFVYFRSLTLILVVTTFGIASVGGALAGALFFVVLPELTGGRNSEAVQALTIGLAAIALARHPEGLVGAAAARARSALDGLAGFVGRVRAVGRPVAERVRDAGVAP
jgi:branched-chain amino acid transport system permease protein